MILTALLICSVSIFPQAALLFQNEIKHDDLQTELQFVAEGAAPGEILIGADAYQEIPGSQFLKSIPIVHKYNINNLSQPVWSVSDQQSADLPLTVDFFNSIFYSDGNGAYWWVTNKNGGGDPRYTLFQINDQNGNLNFIKDIDSDRNGSWNGSFIASSQDFSGPGGIIKKNIFNVLNSGGDSISGFEYSLTGAIIINHQLKEHGNFVYLVLKDLNYIDDDEVSQLKVVRYDFGNNSWNLIKEIKDTMNASFVYTDFDNSGNLYLAYRHDNDSLRNVEVYKLNPDNGDVIWHKQILKDKDINGLAISNELGVMALAGDYFDADNNLDRRGYFSIIKLETGEELYTQLFNFNQNPPMSVQMHSAVITSDNQLVLGARIYFEQPSYHVNSYVAGFDLNVLTGIEENANAPAEFNLSQNYPNPFNPSTKINFSLPAGEHVTLKVYDVLGREVTTLLNEEKSAGAYSIDFDGSGLTSGIYFYRINAGSFNQTRSMMLVK